MKNLDILAQEKAEAIEDAKAKEQADQELRQTLEAAAKGEHLPEDFEEVTAEEGRTFSQDDVNRIIRDRLAKERTKFADSSTAIATKLSGYEATLTEREQRLKNDEHRFMAKQELSKRGYNTDDGTLEFVLGADAEETMQKINKLHLVTQIPEDKPEGKPDLIRRVMGLRDR